MKAYLHHLFLTGLAGCVVLAGTSLAPAQEEVRTQRETRVRETRAVTSTGVRRISILMDARVALRGADDVGKVTDFILNEHGCVDYLVVSYRDHYVLVPWSAATADFQDHIVRIDITEERWREVPTFTRDRWPDLSDRAYTQRLYTSFGVRGTRGERRLEGTPDRPGTERRPDVTPDRRGTERRPDVTPDRRDPERRDERRLDREDRRDNRTPQVQPGDRPTREGPAVRPEDRRPTRPGTRPTPEGDSGTRPADPRTPAERPRPGGQ